MEYVGLVFGIFGLLAFVEMSGLKNRVKKLERQLAATEGTEFYEEKISLAQAVESYMGQEVKLYLKEDCEDADIICYGNTKHGSNTIIESDGDWVLMRISTPKGEKDKLIRLESIEKISSVGNGDKQ